MIRCLGDSLSFSVFYLFNYALYALILAFFPLHCSAIGLGRFEIAVICAAGSLAVVVGAPACLQAAHHWLAPRRLLILTSLAAVLCFIPLFFVDDFLLVLIFSFVSFFAHKGAQALADARAVRDAASGLIVFQHVRLWGSLGFIGAGYIYGLGLDHVGPGMILACGGVNLLFLMLAASRLAPHLESVVGRQTSFDPIGASADAEHHESVANFALLVLVSFCHYVGHSVYYAYFSLYLAELGWGGGLISTAWNIGVVSEIAFFLGFARFERHLSLMVILRLSLLASIVRWLILASTTSTHLILASQTLHAFSFAGVYLSSVKLAFRFLPRRLKDRGQGMLSGFGGGLGTMVGMLLAGTMAESLDSLRQLDHLFLYSALVTAAACGLALVCREKPVGRP